MDVRNLKVKGDALVLNNSEPDPDGSTKFFQAKGRLKIATIYLSKN